MAFYRITRSTATAVAPSRRRCLTAASSKAMILEEFYEPIHVLGAGSIGMLFASSIRVAFPSYPIKLLLRPNSKSRLQQTEGWCGHSKYIAHVSVRSIQNEKKHSGRRPQTQMVLIPAELIEPTNTSYQNQKTGADTPIGSGDESIISAIKDKPIRNLLLSTKAPDAANAIRSILHRLDTNTETSKCRIIILSNGALSVRETVDKVLRDNLPLDHVEKRIKLVLASTTHGAYRTCSEQVAGDDDDDKDESKFHLVHAGVGKTFIENEPSLARMMDRAGLAAFSVSRLEATKLMWYKLAANCTINPITALLGCENGGLLFPPFVNDTTGSSSDNGDMVGSENNNEYQTIMKNVICEISQVAIAEIASMNAGNNGYDDNDDDGGGDNDSVHDTVGADSSLGNLRLDGKHLNAFVQQVIRDTARNKSSMLQDMIRKQRTEIDFLNGYVARTGATHGLETCSNRLLLERVERVTAYFT